LLTAQIFDPADSPRELHYAGCFLPAYVVYTVWLTMIFMLAGPDLYDAWMDMLAG
jgi:hypothetical protein